MNLKNKQEIIAKFGANDKDTGSANVQIAMLTKKISELTEHMKSNKKDFATKRGLLMMVGKRKRMLSFLKENALFLFFLIIFFLNDFEKISLLTKFVTLSFSSSPFSLLILITGNFWFSGISFEERSFEALKGEPW